MIQHWVWSIKLMILEYKSHLIWIRVIIHTTYAKKANKLLGLLRRCTLAFQNPPTRRLLYLSFFSYAIIVVSSKSWAYTRDGKSSTTSIQIHLEFKLSFRDIVCMRNIYNTSFLFAGRLDLLFLFKVIHGLVTLPSDVCPAFYVAVHAILQRWS